MVIVHISSQHWPRLRRRLLVLVTFLILWSDFSVLVLQ